MHGRVWPCMAVCGHAWPDMAMYKINENPKSKIPIRCVKLPENPENLGFAFFGFLPPYLSVSDSLAYFKRRGLKRSIVSYKKFLMLGIQPFLCLNPWEFMEIHGNPRKSTEIHGDPCRGTRSTLQNLICYRMSVSRASGTPCGSVFGRFCVARFVRLEQLCGKISRNPMNPWK